MSRLVGYRSLVSTVFRDARLAKLKRGIGFQPVVERNHRLEAYATELLSSSLFNFSGCDASRLLIY